MKDFLFAGKGFIAACHGAMLGGRRTSCQGWLCRLTEGEKLVEAFHNAMVPCRSGEAESCQGWLCELVKRRNEGGSNAPMWLLEREKIPGSLFLATATIGHLCTKQTVCGG